MKISKSIFLLLLWSFMALGGVWIPLACTNTASNFLPTKPSTPVVASATATNAFGYTSTPTFTLQPTGTLTNTPTIALPAMTGPVTVCTPNVPNAVAVNSAGTTLYVAGGDGTLSIYHAGSVLVPAVATVTGYNGIVFGDLAGVAVGPGANPNYYVLDSGTAAVYEFDHTNAPVTSWNSYSGMTFSTILPPQGIAVDSSENIYVVDTGNNVVDEFTASGAATVAQWGYSGSGSGYFNDPTGIAIGPSSSIYVADMGNGVIQKFSSPGVFVSQIATVINPAIVMGLAVDSSNGNIFAADYNNYQVEMYKAIPPSVNLSAGAPVTLLSQWAGPTSIPVGSNFGPAGIAYDGTHLYVADYDNNSVYQITPP